MIWDLQSYKNKDIIENDSLNYKSSRWAAMSFEYNNSHRGSGLSFITIFFIDSYN